MDSQNYTTQSGAQMLQTQQNLNYPKKQSNGGISQQQDTATADSSNSSYLMSQLQQIQQMVASQYQLTQQTGQQNPTQNSAAALTGSNSYSVMNEQQQKSLNTQQQIDQSVSSSNLNALQQSQNQPQYGGVGGMQSNPQGLVPGMGMMAGQMPYVPYSGMPQMYGAQMSMGYDMMGGGAAGFNPYLFGMAANPQPMNWYMNGQAASFHVPGPKNEIKLFVGGLQFQTSENDLIQYFSTFGQVGDAIVMRDKTTGRGRGFGFVRMIFKDDDSAESVKQDIINQNQEGGHFILDKKVDVKSADDYQGKQGGPGGGMMGSSQHQQNQPMVQKPNPYVMVEAKGEDNQEVTFKYPKSKIFVGGLDFKLTVEELKQHFSQYGPVEDAIILKDIYTGQSRGFGFVQFVDEDVAQNLIKNIKVTTINGRKADLKKAEPKLGGPFIPQKGNFLPNGQMQYQTNQQSNHYSAPAIIPPYGAHERGSRSSSKEREDRRSNSKGRHGGGGDHKRHRRRDSRSRSGSYKKSIRKDYRERDRERDQGSYKPSSSKRYDGGSSSAYRDNRGERDGGQRSSRGHDSGARYREDSRERKRRS